MHLLQSNKTLCSVRCSRLKLAFIVMYILLKVFVAYLLQVGKPINFQVVLYGNCQHPSCNMIKPLHYRRQRILCRLGHNQGCISRVRPHAIPLERMLRLTDGFLAGLNAALVDVQG